MSLSRYFRLLVTGFALCFGLGALSTNALGAVQIDVRTYVPAASTSSGYVSFLRIINKGSVATPVTVTVIDGSTGLAWATGTLTTSLPAQAAVYYTTQQIEAALGVTLPANDRPRIRVVANTQIEAQSFLLQPGGVFNEISDSQAGSSTITTRTFVPAASASSGYVSYLRIINVGTAATAIAVAKIDPVTGQTGAAGTLTASLPAGAAIFYSAAEIEAALGVSIAADERSRIQVTGASSLLDVQSFLTQPGGAFTNITSGKTGTTVDVSTYLPVAVSGYTSFLRVINVGAVAAPVSVALIDDVTGVTGPPAILSASLPASAATFYSSSQVEAALGSNISASARPRIRISSLVPLEVQSFLLQPDGAYNEFSGTSSGISVDVRSYIPAADASSGYISYLRVINTGIVATPVTIALVDGVTGTVGNTGTLIASLPAGGASTLTPTQVEAALGSAIASGSRPRIRITGSTVLEVQSFLVQPGGAFTEVSGGQTSSAILIVGLMGGAIQGNALGYIPNLTTLAGSNTAGTADGIGTAALFNVPYGITTDGTNLYVVDTFNQKIRQIVIATGAVTTLAGSGTIGATDGAGTAASFQYPWRITTDGTNLYVADTFNQKIRQIVIATGAVTTLAGSGTAGALDGTGTAASFNTPRGITTDGTNLYVADSQNNKIRKIVIATGAVTTLAGSGVAGAVDGTGTAASFNFPLGITTDGTNLYIADTINNIIRKIVIATGAVTTLAGSGVAGAVDGTGTAASFNYPMDTTTDGINLYVTDTVNNIIRKIVIATGTASTLNFLPLNTTIQQPIGITTDGNSLYVTENNTIKKIMPPPTVTGMIPSTGATGETITIIGVNFDITPGNNTVTFNGTQAVVTAATATTITVTVPSGATTGTVSVATAGGTAASVGSFTISVPVVSISPASLAFASQNIGTTSAVQTVTLSNTGNGTLNISSIVASGDYASTTTCGTTLAAGASCTISVTFTPAASGARTGAVTITSNAATSPSTVNLSGTGVTAPVLSISPASLAFASQNIGTTSAVQAVTLSNTGNGVLNISSIVTSGDYASTTTCGATLAAGASCTISVTFTPAASGARTGTVTITSNAATSPSTVSLTGTGLAVSALQLFTINATCTINQPCNAPLVANVTGGLAPYHFQQDSFMYGSRPLNTNIDLSTGNIIGTPTQAGVYTFNLCVVDVGGTQNCQPVTVTVNPTLPLTGTWTGTWAWSGPGANGCQFSDGGSFSMTLTQTGTSFSGTTSGAGIQIRDNATCALMLIDAGAGTTSGTITGTALNLSFDLSDAYGTLSFTGTATLNNNTLTGAFVRSTGGSGSFTLTGP